MNVLLVNSKVFECGVFQYGKRISNILKDEDRFNFLNAEVDSFEEFNSIVVNYNPDVIIYNWHTSTMPWLNFNITTNLKHKKQLFVFHESNLPNHLHNNGYLTADMTSDPTNKLFPLIRPIFNVSLNKIENKIPVIGSFGFGFSNKGFPHICSLVSNTFETALIKLHITNAFFGDYTGNTTRSIIEQCKHSITNPNVSLEVSTNFLSDEEILQFLNLNTINVFLYDDMHGRGLSSVIDYAVSVNTPLAVNNSYMFRHITSETPDISIANNFSLKEIISNGTKNVEHYRLKWSHTNFKNNLYDIINCV